MLSKKDLGTSERRLWSTSGNLCLKLEQNRCIKTENAKLVTDQLLLVLAKETSHPLTCSAMQCAAPQFVGQSRGWHQPRDKSVERTVSCQTSCRTWSRSACCVSHAARSLMGQFIIAVELGPEFQFWAMEISPFSWITYHLTKEQELYSTFVHKLLLLTVLPMFFWPQTTDPFHSSPALRDTLMYRCKREKPVASNALGCLQEKIACSRQETKKNNKKLPITSNNPSMTYQWYISSVTSYDILSGIASGIYSDMWKGPLVPTWIGRARVRIPQITWRKQTTRSREAKHQRDRRCWGVT